MKRINAHNSTNNKTNLTVPEEIICARNSGVDVGGFQCNINGSIECHIYEHEYRNGSNSIHVGDCVSNL